MDKQRAISSWSGGKDSCLACYKALQQGYEVKYLLNFISREYKRSCFHGIEAKLLQLQSQLIGIPLRQNQVASYEGEYEKEFKRAVEQIKETQKIEKIIFGDVYLQAHKDWVESICDELKVTAVEPLWGNHPKKIVEEFIDAGFRAIVVSGKSDIFESGFVGRYLDRDLLNEIERKGVCPCGEKGEFHTFVVDGPIFSKRIEITKSEPVLKDGFWSYWFLDIQDYRVVEKI